MYDWGNGISDDWLYSGNVEPKNNISGHDSVIFFNGGGSHPTLILNFDDHPEYKPANDSQVRTISMWLCPNNTENFNIAVSPQLFMVFNASDSHIWYLDFTIVYGGVWIDTNYTYYNNTWVFMEWSFNNVAFNITMSNSTHYSRTLIVNNASLNPYFALPQPNYIDYIQFTTASIETNGFYIDTINLDWVQILDDVSLSNIPSDATWLNYTYFWMNNFTFQFDNALANYRNVCNFTIHYSETQNSFTPIHFSALQQWHLDFQYYGLNIAGDYSGDVFVSNQLYTLYINDNGQVNLILLHGSANNLQNTISASISGYFWKNV